MRDSDEESTAGESWMDASIRLHLRQQAGGTPHNCVDREGDIIVPLSPPPHGYDQFDTQVQVPVIVAELVEDEDEEEDKRAPATAPPPESPSSQNQTSQQGNPPSNPWPRTANTNTNTNTNTRRRRGCVPVKRKNRFKTDISISRFIVTRTSLPYTIEHNDMTLEWTALINTSQEALDANDTEMLEDTVVTMVFKSIEEAREACHAYAPPRMHSFEDSPKCHICKNGFNRILRRPSHCRNCGVCVCSSCTRNWPSSMLPVTYHMSKRKRAFKVCMACDWLNGTFRHTLLSGDHDKAVALQSTGNVNTRNHFANVRGETYYPVHCAVLGGHLAMFKWLVNSLCCPIQSRCRMPLHQIGSIIGNEQIVTSRGKSVLDLAMESAELGILHFLIIEKGVNIMQYKNLMVALRTLKATIQHLPDYLKYAE